MSGISSLGIGSGLDLGALVDGLVRAERAMAEGPLNRNQLRAETRLSALNSLKTAVGRLATAVDGLANFTVARRISSSDESVATGNVAADAENAHYRLQVQQLAIAQSLATNGLEPFSDADDVVGGGTLTLSLGEISADLDLPVGATLRDARDAINASGLEVRAVIVRDGEGYRLLLTSGVTGTAGEMTLVASGGVDTRLASAMMEVTAIAQDARYRVNGLELDSASNTISDVLPGVTLQLRGPTAGDATITLDIVPDREGVRAGLTAVVTAYNALLDTVAASGGGAGHAAGPLTGDAVLRSLQSRLGTAFAAGIDTGLAENPFANAVSIGLQTDAGGRASLDADRLNAALESNEAGAEAFVAAFAEQFGTALKAFSAGDGVLSSRTKDLDLQLGRISRQRAALDFRMERVEARLRKQFGALDSLVSQFQSTSTFLTQQLAGLESLIRRR